MSSALHPSHVSLWQEAHDPDLLTSNDIPYEVKNTQHLKLIHRIDNQIRTLAAYIQEENWLDSWTHEGKQELSHGVVDVYHLPRKGAPKLFACVSTIGGTIQDWIDLCVDKLESTPDWYADMRQQKNILRVSDRTQVNHVISHDVLGGLVKSRDFETIRTWRRCGDTTIIGETDGEGTVVPPVKSSVRGINRAVVRATQSDPKHIQFVWISDLDLKGFLPRAIVDRALKFMMFGYSKAMHDRMNS